MLQICNVGGEKHWEKYDAWLKQWMNERLKNALLGEALNPSKAWLSSVKKKMLRQMKYNTNIVDV